MGFVSGDAECFEGILHCGISFESGISRELSVRMPPLVKYVSSHLSICLAHYVYLLGVKFRKLLLSIR